MTHFKEIANTVSGLLGFAGPTYFAWTIYQDHIPQNVATWSMTLLLDALGLILAYKAGNKRPLMQLGWFAAAFCIVTAILVGHSPWHWGIVEYISLLLCVVAIVLWLILNAKIAIFAYLAAVLVAAVPLLVDYGHNPQRSTTWIWVLTVLTCLLSIYGAKKQDVEYTLVPWGAIALNGLFIYLCVR